MAMSHPLVPGEILVPEYDNRTGPKSESRQRGATTPAAATARPPNVNRKINDPGQINRQFRRMLMLIQF
jgi:hypothetical protein